MGYDHHNSVQRTADRPARRTYNCRDPYHTDSGAWNRGTLDLLFLTGATPFQRCAPPGHLNMVRKVGGAGGREGASSHRTCAGCAHKAGGPWGTAVRTTRTREGRGMSTCTTGMRCSDLAQVNLVSVCGAHSRGSMAGGSGLASA